jgi:hypothetical protein
VKKSKEGDPDWKLLEPIAKMKGEDGAETRRLRKMYETAKDWIEAQPWASPVVDAYFGMGVGNVVALFVVELRKRPGQYSWLVTGDLPHCAFITEDIPDAAEALEWYCELMDGWAQAVLAKKDLSDVYPVDAEPTRENGRALASRVKFLRKEIIPEFRKALDEARSS